MARRLERTVTRRVINSDMVISVRPEGLALRRHRCRAEVVVIWEELFKQYLPAKIVYGRFATAAPTRWLPRVGESVYALARDWERVRRVRVVKVLAGCGEEIIRVKYRRREHDLLLSQVRPIGK